MIHPAFYALGPEPEAAPEAPGHVHTEAEPDFDTDYRRQPSQVETDLEENEANRQEEPVNVPMPDPATGNGNF